MAGVGLPPLLEIVPPPPAFRLQTSGFYSGWREWQEANQKLALG
jgi:hypothetical protein